MRRSMHLLNAISASEYAHQLTLRRNEQITVHVGQQKCIVHLAVNAGVLINACVACHRLAIHQLCNIEDNASCSMKVSEEIMQKWHVH